MRRSLCQSRICRLWRSHSRLMSLRMHGAYPGRLLSGRSYPHEYKIERMKSRSSFAKYRRYRVTVEIYPLRMTREVSQDCCPPGYNHLLLGSGVGRRQIRYQYGGKMLISRPRRGPPQAAVNSEWSSARIEVCNCLSCRPRPTHCLDIGTVPHRESSDNQQSGIAGLPTSSRRD